jgi:predicted enzyme related to lactoylglutathione lyase
MPSRFDSVVVDCTDPAALARFWTNVLGWQIVSEAADEVVLAKDETTLPCLLFGTATDEKVTKNRLHIDLVPDDQDAEVERILALGATRADVGESDDVTWVVLADPEGNEFCVLTPRAGGM